MVEDVEDLRAQLHAQVLSELRVFEDREVDVLITRPTQRVAAKRTEVPSSRNAGCGAAIAARIERTGNFESGKVDELIGRVRTGVRIADEIRPREKLDRKSTRLN